MVSKVVTYCECDSCPHWELVESPRGILRGYKKAPYPANWQYVSFGNDGDGDWLCPKCAQGAQQAYTKYKQQRMKEEEEKKNQKKK